MISGPSFFFFVSFWLSTLVSTDFRRPHSTLVFIILFIGRFLFGAFMMKRTKMEREKNASTDKVLNGRRLIKSVVSGGSYPAGRSSILFIFRPIFIMIISDAKVTTKNSLSPLSSGNEKEIWREEEALAQRNENRCRGRKAKEKRVWPSLCSASSSE